MNRRFHSIEFNMVLNTMKTMLHVVVPLITFPYVARVLQVENLGKVHFAQSFISYFSLIASLGISTYVIREGGRYRHDIQLMKTLADQAFTLNIMSTAIAYVCLGLIILVTPKLQQYTVLLLIQSTTIIFTTIGVDWLNVIYEDYLYITVRSIVVQLISVLLIFTLIRDTQDYSLYLSIQAATFGLIALSNYFHLGKVFFRPRITFNVDYKRHIKPILILFSNNLAVTVYLNIDSVMLGLMTKEYYVGLYAVAVKVYVVCKQLISAVYTVAVTRLTAYYSSESSKDYSDLLNKILNNILFVMIPIMTGLFITSKELILLFGGNEYIEATNTLRILVITIPFAVCAGALVYCVNLPMKREKNSLVATSISAIENLLLNLAAIPLLKASGAALTTLIAEATVVFILLWNLRGDLGIFDYKTLLINIIKCCIACLPMIAVALVVNMSIQYNTAIYLAIIIPVSAVFYVIVSFIVKNNIIIDLNNKLLKRLSAL